MRLCPSVHKCGHRVIAALVLVIAATGCGVARKGRTAVLGNARVPVIGVHRNTRFSVQINVADGANQNSPIPVDFAMIMDKKLMLEVARLSSRDWYDRRIQIQRDFPKKVQIVSWEWVPGYHVGPISIEVEPETLGAFLFANYSNAGEHRAYVDVRAPIVVNLGAEEFTVQALR